ncbi:MAG: NuoM family protein [Actinomycetales bacterium]
MSDAVLSTLLLLAVLTLPPVGAVVAACSRRRPDVAIAAALTTSLLTLILELGLLALTVPWRSGSDVASIDLAWMGSLGPRLHFGWDGITAPLVLLTSLLTTLGCCYLWFSADDALPGETGRRAPSAGLVAVLATTHSAALLTFTARDLIVFFIAFEAVLAPMWVLIGRWGGDPDATDQQSQQVRRRRAATTFVLYTALGSAIMLLGLLLLAGAVGSTGFEAVAAAGPRLPLSTQAIVALLLIIGLGVKVPMWPLHSWLPPAHTIAPTVGSVLLAGVLLKLGSYGLVRIAVGFVPEGVQALAVGLAALGVTGILWGGLVCLVEPDLKRLIAFSSVAHMGFVVLGVAAGTPAAIQGALFVGIAHGLISSLLFWVVGMLKHRHLAATVRASADLRALPAGLRDSHPRLGWTLALGSAAGLGLPGLAGFWGEILVLIGTWNSPRLAGIGSVLSVLAALGTVLAGAYLLRVLYLIWQGPSPTLVWSPPDASQPQDAAPQPQDASQPQDTDPAAGVPVGAAVGPAAVASAPHPPGAAKASSTAAPPAPSIHSDAEPDSAAQDLTGIEVGVVAPLVFFIVGFGVAPGTLLALTGPAVRALLGVG